MLSTGKENLWVNDVSEAARVEEAVSFSCPRKLYRSVVDNERSDFASSRELSEEDRFDRFMKWALSKLDEEGVSREREFASEARDSENPREKFIDRYVYRLSSSLGRSTAKVPHRKMVGMGPQSEEYDTVQDNIAAEVNPHLEAFAGWRWEEHVSPYLEEGKLPPGVIGEDEGETPLFDSGDLAGFLNRFTVPEELPHGRNYIVSGRPDFAYREDGKLHVGEIKVGRPRPRYDGIEVIGYMMGMADAAGDDVVGELLYAPEGPSYTIEMGDENFRNGLELVARSLQLIDDLFRYDSAGNVEGNASACWNCDYNNAAHREENETYGCPEDE